MNRGHAPKVAHRVSDPKTNTFPSEPGIDATTPVDWERTKPGKANPEDSYTTTRTDTKGRPTWLA